MQLIAYGLIALAILGAIGTGVYKVKQWGAGEVRKEWADAVATQRESDRLKSFAAATGLQKDRAEARTAIETRTRYVNKEVEKIVYRSICLPDIGLCLANAAIGGKVAAGCQPDGTVPAVKPSD